MALESGIMKPIRSKSPIFGITIISSIVAALVGFFGTFALRDPIGSALMDPTIELMRNNWLYLSAAIMIIGIMIGVISALLATRKYVKVR